MPPKVKFLFHKMRNKDADHSRLLQLKERRKELKDELEYVERKLNEVETTVLVRMSKGTLSWCWKVVTKKRIVKWKEAFIEYVGQREADLLIARTKESEYIHVGVKGFDDE